MAWPNLIEGSAAEDSPRALSQPGAEQGRRHALRSITLASFLSIDVALDTFEVSFNIEGSRVLIT
ncbi:hypothetical protein D9M69_652820 [compost metagenome]